MATFPGDYTLLAKQTTVPSEVVGSGSHTDLKIYVDQNTFLVSMMDTGAKSILNGGGDLRASSDEAGTIQLALDVVTFVTNATPSSTDAEVWVTLASVSTSVGTDIYWWGLVVADTQPAVTDTFGSRAVHSSANDNYAGHMDGSSPINSVDGTVGTLTDATADATGEIGDCVDFGDDRTGRLDTELNFTGLGSFSIQAWAKYTGTAGGAEDVIFSMFGNTGAQQSILLRYESGGSGTIEFFTSADSFVGGNYTGTNIDDGSFHHVVADYDGSDMIVLIDGVQSVTTFSNTGDCNSNVDVYIGDNDQNTTDRFRGSIDEVWLSTTESSDFHKTTYNNQSDPSTFAPMVEVEGGIVVLRRRRMAA